LCLRYLKFRDRGRILLAGLCAASADDAAETVKLVSELHQAVIHARRKGALVLVLGDLHLSGEATPQRPPLTRTQRLNRFVEQLGVCSHAAHSREVSLDSRTEAETFQLARERAYARLDFCLEPYGPPIAAGIFHGFCSDSEYTAAVADVPVRENREKCLDSQDRPDPPAFNPAGRGGPPHKSRSMQAQMKARSKWDDRQAPFDMVKGRESVSLVSGTWVVGPIE
jgi:hypothetical protein